MCHGSVDYMVMALENRSLSGLWLWTQWVVALENR